MSGLEDEVAAEQEASLVRAVQRAQRMAQRQGTRAARLAQEEANEALGEKVMASTDPIAIAVRELHSPAHGVYSGYHCAGCTEECAMCDGSHVWPCETILVVAEALP